MRLKWLLLSLSCLLVLTSCKPPLDDGPPDYDGPGSEAWGSEDISCDDVDDCLSGEVCIDGICQVDRCSTGLSGSSSPVGQGLVFLQENEVAVADSETYEGAYWLDGYGPSGSSLDYDYSWEVGDDQVLDIAGGDLDGSGAEVYVAVVDGREAVAVLDGQSVQWNNLDFQPVAVAAGDVDGDGQDEVVAVNDGTEMAVCGADPWSCDYWEFSGNLHQIDVTLGDVDGDAIEEPVVLFEYDGYYYLYVNNIDGAQTGQPEAYSAGVDGDHIRVTSSDLDGDRLAEVIVLLDGGWWGWGDDEIAVYHAQENGEDSTLVLGFQVEIDGHTGLTDLVAADIDLDEKGEVLVVNEDGEAAIFQGSANNLTGGSFASLGVTASSARIATADHDGDSPRARLVEGPVACQGAVVPMNLMLMPPYHADHAAGFPSSVMFGDMNSTSESMSDTVSLGLHVDVGVGGGFMDVFKAEFNETLQWRVTETATQTTSMTIGSRYTLRAYPEVYGPYYGGVALSWGCFDAYTYEVDDPSNHIGGANGKEFVMVVPTGGNVSLWSTSRYNALAEATDNMPILEVPYAVGTVDSYPTEPERLDGSAIPSSDNLFTNPTNYTVSDVGETVWWMEVGQAETNQAAMDMSMGASASVTVSGIKVGGGVDMGWGQAYSLKTGSVAAFAGSIPTLRDDPDTPEDEYSVYAYTVTPYVYMQPYTTPDGEEAAYYVQTYTQSR